MPIVINLDVVLAKRKLRSKELSDAIGLSEQNLSILKTGKAKAIRLKTLEAICKKLRCQPGDLLAYQEEMGQSPLPEGSGLRNQAGVDQPQS